MPNENLSAQKDFVNLDSSSITSLESKTKLFNIISYFIALLSFTSLVYYLFFEKDYKIVTLIFAFILIAVINVGIFVYHRDLNIHVNFLILLCLVTPFLIHIINYENSAKSPILWGIAAPFISILLQDHKKAQIWLGSFIALFIGLLLVDSQYSLQNNYAVLLSQAGFITLAFLSFGMINYISRKNLFLTSSQIDLESEKSKSDALVHELLPEQIAMRLKHENPKITDSFDEVTVLFADMVNFTEISSKLTPLEVVDLLNVIFSSLDRIVEEYGMEKIKTMGDAYMAASGIPFPIENHAEIAANVAIRFQEEIAKFRDVSGLNITMRLGLHSGPVVAGVIGIKKKVYDLWGDTVNVASRMEHYGLPGKIQVTKDTYNLLRDKFSLIPRGPIDIKGKGLMETYLLIEKKTDHKLNLKQTLEIGAGERIAYKL